MYPEENVLSDNTEIVPVEESGEGDDQKVEVTRTIQKEVVETITIGEAKNKLDFVTRQLSSLEEQKDAFLSKHEEEKGILQKELEKYQNIINSVN